MFAQIVLCLTAPILGTLAFLEVAYAPHPTQDQFLVGGGMALVLLAFTPVYVLYGTLKSVRSHLRRRADPTFGLGRG